MIVFYAYHVCHVSNPKLSVGLRILCGRCCDNIAIKYEFVLCQPSEITVRFQVFEDESPLLWRQYASLNVNILQREYTGLYPRRLSSS
jgi:hypothetical protein